MLHVRDILPRVKPGKRKSQGSALADAFASQVRSYQLPPPVRELRFAAKKFGRQWRFDFCWPQYLLAVEIDGLVVRRVGGELVAMGRHATAQGMREDMNKGNAAILLGWHCLHFERTHIKSGDAIAVTQRALVVRGWTP